MSEQLQKRLKTVEAENARLRVAMSMQSHEVEQALGKALGYPRYVDDLANFPNATDADGVCVGDHTAASLADEAAARINSLGTALGVYAEPDNWRPDGIRLHGRWVVRSDGPALARQELGLPPVGEGGE